jgi:hypothetical protein
MVERPLDAEDHRGQAAVAIAVQHADVDEVGLGCDADVLAL